jgi:pimeloyl-ACP methyl ester carboxylesterase
MREDLMTVFHEALPDGRDPRIHWIRYEPTPADEAGGAPAMNLTLVMIPGAGHSALAFDLLARRLARMGLRSVAINPRGKGVGDDVSLWSRSIHRATTLDAVADVISVMEHLSATQFLPPNRYIVLGHSYGGIVARYVAQQRAVSGLILLQSFMPDQFGKVVFSFTTGMLRRGHPYLALLPPISFTSLFTTRRRRRITILGSNATSADDARCAAQLCRESRKALLDTVALGRASYAPRALGRLLTDQALVFGGGADRMVPWRTTRQVADDLEWRGVRQVSWQLLPAAPHDAFLMDAHVGAIADAIPVFFGSLLASRIPVGDGRMDLGGIAQRLGETEIADAS